MTQDEEWIKEVKDKIIEEDDKVLFEEAAGCFLSGHYRAAYIVSWISLIESLKRKIHMLSNYGDSKTTDAKQKIEATEKKNQSADKLIYDEARNCGIIDDADYSKVHFLWEQRCLFAHPYDLKPRVNEVKYIIEESLEISLGKELHFNKTYLEELADNISNKPFFPTTQIDQVRNYAKHTISRIPERLHPFFFKTLLSWVGKTALVQEKLYELRKLRCFIIELFINSRTPLDNAEWCLEDRVTKYPYECFVGYVHQETWSLLPEKIQEMLISYLEREEDLAKLSTLKSIASHLVQDNKLEAFKNRYHEKLDRLSFDNAIHFYGEPQSKFNRIYRGLYSGVYVVQDSVIDYLRTAPAIELINGLDRQNQIKLGRVLRSAAFSNHYKSQSIITSIVKNGDLNYSEWVKLGIAIASLSNLKDEFDLDSKTLNDFVEIMNGLSIENQNESYDFIESLIKDDKVSYWVKRTPSQPEFINQLTKALELTEDWNTNNKQRFEQLIEKIKNYFAQQEV